LPSQEQTAHVTYRLFTHRVHFPVIEEKIHRDAGVETPQGMRGADLVCLITEAGRITVERDTLYRAVTRTENTFTVAV
jgi:aminodeoxyfutalosine synthase